MPACGYEFYLRVFNSISHEWAQPTSEMSGWTLEDKIRIHARVCNILYIPYLFLNLVLVSFLNEYLPCTYLMRQIWYQKKYPTCLRLFFPQLHAVYRHNELMFGHWTAGVVIELLCGYWTSKKGKQNYEIINEENSDYYYLSNRKMIEVVFSSRVSLLAFYFLESLSV